MTPEFLEARGFHSVPRSVACGYTASGYGFVQDMPYAYIHEFTRTSMAGKIRRFKGGYMSFWQKLSEVLPTEVRCNTKVLAVRRNPAGVCVDVKNSDGEVEIIDFDKIIISGSFPFKNGRTYKAPHSSSAGSFSTSLVCLLVFSFLFFSSKIHAFLCESHLQKLRRR